MIRFFNVVKRYPPGEICALDDVTLHIPRGDFVFLTGASGAGKTTFLKLIFRQEAPTSGQILVNGRNVSSIPQSKIPFLRRTMGVVFQDFRLIARKTVLENVTFLPRVLGVDLAGRKRLAYEALRKVGLAHRANSFPMQLSGGEQQRIAIARAIVYEPELLIADEPTGNLDPDLSREILSLFQAIHRRGTTVLLATHDRATIQRLGGRVITLDRGRLGSDITLPRLDPEPATSPVESPEQEPAEAPGESSLATDDTAPVEDEPPGELSEVAP